MVQQTSDNRINPDMVTVARESRGLTQSDLAKRLGVSQGLLSKVEAGLAPATPSLLSGLSQELRYPEEFFCQPEQIYGPSTSEFYHRKKQDTSAKLLSQLHAQINIRRIHISRLLRSAEPEECRIPRYDVDDFGGDAAEVARAVRAALHIPRGPIKNVIETIEGAGGVVLRWAFPTRSVDAISRWVPGLPPLFILNADIPTDRARHTLCHELGHMVMHHAVRPDMEKEADQFAAELLMPAREIMPYLQGLNSLHQLMNLKPYWKVSMQSLLRRASDLGLIPEGRSRYLWIQLSKAGYRLREPAELDLPREEPSYISDLMGFYREELSYNLEQLGKLLAMTVDEMREQYGLDPWPEERGQLRLVK